MSDILIAPGHGGPMNGIVTELQRLLATEHGQRTAAEIQSVGFNLDHAITESIREPAPPNEWAQPIEYILGWLSWDALVDEGWQPVAVAGHSLGEFLSLAVSGAFSWSDGLHLVRQCGADMDQQARDRPSAMSAILGLTASEAQEVCSSVLSNDEGCLQIANINDQKQIVVSGDVHLVNALENRLATSDVARAIRLNILGAAHSQLHRKSRLLNQAIRTTFLAEPSLPVYLSTSPDPVRTSTQALDSIAGILVRQVHWPRTLDRVVADYPDFKFRLAYPDRALSKFLARRTQRRSHSRQLQGPSPQLTNGGSA
ncbi:ACP S-malonyltransferase [Leucobacter sp. M11]|uniref:ACP S-malonyltransferase n=1 Tax=Leucobacter sp. M11 TaxID=2993565 RepID=UPI002D7F4CA1|nr:acyltransferase domain-containing protein [Leucobacter sp. M11]MEB4613747.1 acyltransferase domain-containing protein [Leucobacter sp. M11]